MGRNLTTETLQQLCLRTIAQDPKLAFELLHDNDFVPHLKIALIELAFINLLPVELQLHIVNYLPFNSWQSLSQTNRAWHSVVMSATNSYLNSLNAKPELAPQYIASILENLNKEVKQYEQTMFGAHPKRGLQVKQIKNLITEVNGITNSLAKWHHFKRKLHIISQDIEDSCNTSFSFFSGARHSRLFNITVNALSSGPSDAWLKKAIAYTTFSPTHPFSQNFLEELDRIQKKNTNKPKGLITRISSVLPGL
ncbi:F-box protein [Legionella cardiaca]|uniref:F-box protein n=1 Tax=Legionella cardiaca TaxID=1071983 RepID=A0ABY8AWX3_9GAMM|nr:F-box protein [Legionella cardiaca]WED43926.1 F-box protein [Legionella cardiaca]